MILVQCEKCGKTVTLQDDSAGTDVACPSCEGRLSVPASPDAEIGSITSYAVGDQDTDILPTAEADARRHAGHRRASEVVERWQEENRRHGSVPPARPRHILLILAAVALIAIVVTVVFLLVRG